MHNVLLHHTKCYHQEQMASVATVLWHSILQNNMSLSSERYWFLSMFPACSIALVTTTTSYVKYTEEIKKKVYPRVLDSVQLAVCPSKSSNPLTPTLILFSQKETGFLSFLSKCLNVRKHLIWSCDGHMAQSVIWKSDQKDWVPVWLLTTQLPWVLHYPAGLQFLPLQRIALNHS